MLLRKKNALCDSETDIAQRRGAAALLYRQHQNGRTALRRRRVDPTEKLRDKKRDQRYAQDRRWEPAQPGRTRFGQFTEDTDEAVNGRAFIDKIHAARAAKVEAVCAAQQLALLGACR